MPVDVRCEIVIARGRSEVAAYSCDPDNATAWYENIEAVEWLTPRPPEVGTQLAFLARFMGRRLAYTYEVMAAAMRRANRKDLLRLKQILEEPDAV